MYISATKIRVGQILDIKGDPCKVMGMTHITPGKGNAVVQTKMRNMKTGTQFEQRFRSAEDVKRAYMDEQEMEFLYADDNYNFMNTESYEQIAVSPDLLGDAAKWLVPNTKIQVLFFEGDIMGVTLPKTMILEVTETTPHLRGATATNSPKPAELENGVTINVPPFIEVGEKIKVDPEAGTYVERAKD
jgi:elongation factor P